MVMTSYLQFCVDLLEDVVKFISSPKASQVLSLSLLRVLFTLFFFSFILFTFTSFPLDFVSLNKLNALLLELKMIIFGNYLLSLLRNVIWGKNVFHVSQDEVK